MNDDGGVAHLHDVESLVVQELLPSNIGIATSARQQFRLFGLALCLCEELVKVMFYESL